MTEQAFDRQKNILGQVREGMDVYDRDDQKVGTVNLVYPGTQPTAPTASDPAALDTDLFDIGDDDIVAPGEVPEPVRKRLLHDGFVKVKGGGLFGSDLYILPEQLDHVSGDQVILHVTQDELVND